MTLFKPRQRVWIINCTLGGRSLVEGRAWVVRHLGDDRYLVRFPNGDLVERFVDPKAQTDPYAYVRTRNNNEAASPASPVKETSFLIDSPDLIYPKPATDRAKGSGNAPLLLRRRSA